MNTTDINKYYLITWAIAFIFIVLIITLGVLSRKPMVPKSIKKLFSIKRIIISTIICLVLAFLVPFGIACYINSQNMFEEFNLADLQKQELIFQEISFNKFIVQEESRDTIIANSEYTKEIYIYLIKGKAEISFADIESLVINKERSSRDTKTLVFDYQKNSSDLPFNVKVNITDVIPVYTMESKPIKILQAGSIINYNKDLITNTMTPDDQIKKIKPEIQKEFEKQIIDEDNGFLFKKNLEETNIYGTFLTSLEEFVATHSDYDHVEINLND